MFGDACAKYRPLIVHVGEYNGDSRKSYGLGCKLASDFVITAYHVIKKISTQLIVTDKKGHRRCELILQNESLDVALMKIVGEEATEPEADSVIQVKLSQYMPHFGCSLGYLGILKLAKEGGETSSHTYFCGTSISFHIFGEEPRLILSNGIIQKGFSGGPVFLPCGDFVGVVTGSVQLNVGSESSDELTHELPEVSPIYTIKDEITMAMSE